MSSYIAAGVSIVVAVVIVGQTAIAWTLALVFGCIGLALGFGLVLSSGGTYTPLETIDRARNVAGGSTVHRLLCDMMVRQLGNLHVCCNKSNSFFFHIH